MAAHKPNPADRLRTYTVQELERIAASFLQSSPAAEIPIDIDALLETQPNVDLDIYPGLRARYGICGMAGTAADGVLCVYIDDVIADTDAHQRFYRMTVAEELAHILLHREAIETVTSPKDFLTLHSHPKWYEFERNAKRLAAALLMPPSSIIEDSHAFYGQLMSHWPQERPGPPADPVINKLAGRLADRYDVSTTAMQYRLAEWPLNIDEKIKRALAQGLSFLD